MMRSPFSGWLFCALVLGAGSVWSAELPLGLLTHDGPPTPEQISLYLPVSGPLDTAAKASVRYRKGADGKWRTAHPLHRIRPADTAGKKPPDAFAGVITGLAPGVPYTVEVTVKLGENSAVKTLKATTRALPPPAGKPTQTIPAGADTARIQAAFNAAKPGDVIQFANGTYAVGRLQIKKGGSKEKPVYIRGESRGGVVLKNPSGIIIQVLEASDVVLENLTLEGSGKDSGTRSRSHGVHFWDGGKSQERFTFRHLTFRGVDMGIIASKSVFGVLVYDNTLKGNNTWVPELIEKNLTWNDDGIRIPGMGNAAFNNTLIGFGDAMAVNSGNLNAGVHFYRNDVLMTGDDAFESDYGTRNMTFYDNRIHNSATFVSCDPIYGGPLYVFRNISINTGRGPYKLNNKNTGFYIYNNTLVRTNGWGSGKVWPWVQFNNGPLVAWAYRNNILVFQGKPGKLLAIESGGMNPVDFDHNAWYPDGAVWWTNSGGSAGSLDAVRAKLPATKPLFSGITKRHTGDLICEANPFKVEIELGKDHRKQITKLYVPKLKAGAKPRGKGAPIPGVTDGFSGKAPDMGAIITGRPIPVWGDRSKKE